MPGVRLILLGLASTSGRKVNRMTDFKIASFSGETSFLFSELADYIWKMRHQLEQLVIKEREITATEFDGDSMRFRQAMESWKHEHLFPNALHYSFIVLLFITIEDRLKRACDLIHRANNLPLRAKDLRGDSIEQGMIFLEKLASVLRSELSFWPKVSDLVKVRNCIVHTNGHIELSRDKAYLKELIKKNPEHLKVSDHPAPEDQLLIIEHSYCMLSTRDAREFFDEICEKAGIP
jgi:predicted secreted protein